MATIEAKNGVIDFTIASQRILDRRRFFGVTKPERPRLPAHGLLKNRPQNPNIKIVFSIDDL